jgi:hypothetical protein
MTYPIKQSIYMSKSFLSHETNECGHLHVHGFQSSPSVFHGPEKRVCGH